MKKLLFLIFPFLLVSCSIANAPTREYHAHAGFQVFIDNKLQDFSGVGNMYFKPCGLVPDEIKTLKDKVHLHDQIGDVLHIHDATISWKDAMDSIGVVTGSGATFYVDGKEDNLLLTEKITEFESASIFIGKNTDIEKKVAGRVTKERMVEIENKKAENCGKE